MRRRLGVRRVGHSGTLDPFASGLLLMLVGRATRLSQFLVGLTKRYSGEIHLGMVTDTDDRTGEPLRSSDTWRGLSREDIASAVSGLTGRYGQRPPAYSAKKVDGRRAHRLARQGVPVDLPPREVEILAFDVGALRGPTLAFTAHVSSGTYLRALARDLGERLGCGAHLHRLRRTAIGPFAVEQALPLDDLNADSPILPAMEAVRHLPTLELSAGERERVTHGQPIDLHAAGRGPVALVRDAELVAVAEPRNGVLKPRVVLAG